MTNRVLTLGLAAAVLFGATATASAQGGTGTTTEPTYELSAGYQLFRAGEICDDDPIIETCTPDRTYPFGLAIDAARNFGAFSVVGELGWALDSESFDFDDETGEGDLTFNTWHFAGGGRWTTRNAPRLWPFVQVLAGVVHDRVSADDDAFDGSNTAFMLQPGVGATYVAGDGWGIVGQVDYRRVFLDEEEDFASGRNDLRVFIGVRMILD
jgi:hypothetical protein